MNDLIYNQRMIPKDQWRYGFRSSAKVGCGWIAAHNALRLMGYRTDTKAMIRYFQRQLPLIHGNAGTSFWGPGMLFRRWGFPVTACVRRRNFDELAKKSDVCILFYRWRRGWRFGAHFVALQYRNGRFTGYNTFRTSDGPDNYGESLEAFLKRNHFFGAVLYGISDKRNQ